ncbi:MAG TPA: ISAs1 family transposase [Chitinophagaceae bacterium]|jgi:predicted transposase YbfD/YdcC
MHSKKMLTFFDNLTDPRVERTKLHSLKDIVGLTICAVLSGCDDWEEIEMYGHGKHVWLKQFLSLPNGIPSHDTINRVFAALNPVELRDCFLDWVQSVATVTQGRVISIDGKRMCNSGLEGKKGFMHMVSAWCNANNMVLGQVKTDEKSNEITAIPALLELLLLEGAIVTIDAMGCQKDIAEKITTAGADYVLAVKQNQEFLLDDIQEAFEQTPLPASYSSIEKGHGRIEKRTCGVITDMDWICKGQQWENLRSIIRIDTQRTVLQSGETQSEQRFYISSLKATPQQFNQIIRQHWSIENKLHWSLDVTFKEDLSTKQAGNAAENFSIITKIAINLLKNNTTKKTSIKKKRLLCALNDDFLVKSVFKENI